MYVCIISFRILRFGREELLSSVLTWRGCIAHNNMLPKIKNKIIKIDALRLVQGLLVVSFIWVVKERRFAEFLTILCAHYFFVNAL